MSDDRSPTLAPAALYASSGKNAADPAPRSMRTSKPPFVRRPATSGVRATRRSLGVISFGTPIFMGFGSQEPGERDADSWLLIPDSSAAPASAPRSPPAPPGR